MQKLALVIPSIVATYDKSLYRDIYNKWVDLHNKCVYCMEEYFENMWRDIICMFFLSTRSKAVKEYTTKPV